MVTVWMRPGRWTVLALRIVMIAVVLGSLVGVAEHLEGNLELGRETQPNADAMRLFLAALAGGNPLLAPGILAISGALAMAATYSAGHQESSGATRGDADAEARDATLQETSSFLRRELQVRMPR